MPSPTQLIKRFVRSLLPSQGKIRKGAGAGLMFDSRGGNWRYIFGPIEPYEEDVLLKLLKPGCVFYDVGANIGYYAIVAARIVGDAGKVYAFEPFTSTANTIRSNIKLNNLKNIEVHEKAAGATTGKVCINLAEISERNAISLTAASDSKATSPSGDMVDVVALDHFLQTPGVRPPNVIMIDVEGAEIDVFKGLKETLAAHRPAIICEVHWLKDEIYALRDGLFKELKYTITSLDGSPIPQDIVRYHALILPEEVREKYV
jgi:FkbM family methyltransferase